MIDSALAVLVRVLNTHLQKSLSLTEPVVLAAPVVDLDGSVPTIGANKLTLTVTSSDLAFGMPRATSRRGAPARVLQRANFDVVLAANFSSSNYLDGLKLLARAIEFFGTQPVVASTAIPGVAGIKLTPRRIDDDDLEELWSRLGTPYRPSANYTVQVALRRR